MMKKLILIVGAILFFIVVIIPLFTPRTDEIYVNKLQSPTSQPINKAYVLEMPLIGQAQPYKVIKKEIYGNPTAETWKELSKYIRVVDTAMSEANTPIKSIKIYFKSDGITIDIERMKQTYSISDIERLVSSLKDRSKTVIKEESIDIVIPDEVSKEDIQATITQIIQEEITKDNDLDKIFVVAWRKEQDMTDGFTLAYVVWGPKDDVTEKIARENIRDGYFINWIRIDK